MTEKTIATSAPGRICLFGEHQDYLGLPVIAMAINLQITITGSPRPDKIFHIDLPDIKDKEEFSFAGEIPYIRKRDYFRSCVNVLKREGAVFPSGYNCLLRGDIPINAGTSSSSALCVAWVKFLLAIANDDRKNNPYEIARLAHKSEVLEFKEPGGMMDHFTSAIGGLLFIEFNEPTPRVTKLPTRLGSFVLGDSLQGKDTTGMLSRVKNGVLDAVKILSAKNSGFSLANASLDDARHLPDEIKKLFQGAIITRNITRQAKTLLQSENVNPKILGDLLYKQHLPLRDYLKISTPKIDLMIDSAMKSGALGGKINGSGGGGCMFVYAPDSPAEPAQSIKNAGGKPFII
jgi:galactokinase